MRVSVGTGVVLMGVGGVLAFAVTDPPDQIERYVSIVDLGLVLIWVGVLTLVMQVVMHRPRRARPTRSARRTHDDPDWPTDEHDVHRAGYAGETRRLPTVRGGRR